MGSLRSFLRIVDLRVAVVTAAALGSTWLCATLGLQAEMPTTIVSIAVIFPIVFSINAAYVRREEALRAFASMRAWCASIYWAHRDWRHREDDDHRERGRAAVQGLIASVEAYIAAPRAERPARADAVFERFSNLSESVEALRESGMSGGEVSRVNQSLRGAVLDFELMKNIASYRTPVPLRAYSHVFLTVFPVVFGPYFAWLSDSYYPGVGYAVAALYSVVLVGLDNIQQNLEDPFDGVGEDDIRVAVSDDFVASLR